MSRQVPNSRRDSSRPIKRRKPRGLGKGRIPTATTRISEPKISSAPTIPIVEKAHIASSINRRLPLG